MAHLVIQIRKNWKLTRTLPLSTKLRYQGLDIPSCLNQVEEKKSEFMKYKNRPSKHWISCRAGTWSLRWWDSPYHFSGFVAWRDLRAQGTGHRLPGWPSGLPEWRQRREWGRSKKLKVTDRGRHPENNWRPCCIPGEYWPMHARTITPV